MLESTFAAMATNPDATNDELELVAQWAMQHHQLNTLVALCARTNLARNIDQLIGGVENYKVRAAWLARPGRTEDEIVAALAGEKRQRVLAEMAARPGLSAEVYRTICERSRGAVALVALVGSEADIVHRCTAARALTASTYTLTYQQRNTLQKAFSSDDVGAELVDAVLSGELNNPEVTQVAVNAAEFHVLCENSEKIVNALVLRHLPPPDDPGAVKRFTDASQAARKLDELCNITGADPQNRQRWADQLEQLGRVLHWSHAATQKTFDQHVSNIRNGTSDDATFRSYVAALGDGDTEVAARLGVMAGDSTQRLLAQRAITEAYRNNRIDPAVTEAVLDSGGWYVWTLVSKICDLTDTDTATVVGSKTTYLPAWFLPRCSEPLAVLRARAASNGGNADTVLMDVTTWNPGSIDDIVGELPSCVLHAASTEQHQHHPAVRAAWGAVRERYGTDWRRWQMVDEYTRRSAASLNDIFALIDASTS